MYDVGVTYHGVFEGTLGNDAPVVTNGKFQMPPGTQIVRQVLTVGELGYDNQGKIRYPITNWDFFNSVDIGKVNVRASFSNQGFRVARSLTNGSAD